jgi:hypothetical protein
MSGALIVDEIKRRLKVEENSVAARRNALLTAHDSRSASSILSGIAEGPVVAAAEGLSFWGGVDAATGRVIGVHHPLCGVSVAGSFLMMPTSRGSCSG